MYNDANKKASLKYIKEQQKRVYLRYKKSEYDKEIYPAIEKSGKKVATFIKEAVREKIERDGLNEN